MFHDGAKKIVPDSFCENPKNESVKFKSMSVNVVPFISRVPISVYEALITSDKFEFERLSGIAVETLKKTDICEKFPSKSFANEGGNALVSRLVKLDSLSDEDKEQFAVEELSSYKVVKKLVVKAVVDDPIVSPIEVFERGVEEFVVVEYIDESVVV